MKINRDITLDRFRGLLVALMILFGLCSNFNSFGPFKYFTEHAPDAFEKTQEQIIFNDNHPCFYVAPNLAFSDLSVCLFFLAIGFTIIPSYNRKIKKYGNKKATKYMYKRYISLVGIGSCIFTICSRLYNIPLAIYSYPLIFLSIVCYILSIVLLILFVFKRNSNLFKYLKNALSNIIVFMGIFNILLSIFNTIMLYFGLTETFYGYWGVFEHIGCAGVIFIFVVSKFKNNTPRNRLICSIIMFLLFTVFHNTSSPFLSNNQIIKNNLLLIDIFPDGGVVGGFAYASVLMFLTVVGDYYYHDRKKFNIIFYILASLSLIALICSCLSFKSWSGLKYPLISGVSKYFFFNKESISPAYLLVDIYSSIYLFIFVGLFRNKTYKFDILAMFGRNGILFYLIEFLLIQTLCYLIKDVSLLLSLTISGIIIAFLVNLAYFLYKKNLILKL